jgi:hypothetical protein
MKINKTTANDRITEEFKFGRRRKKASEAENSGRFNHDFLNGDWEVFVVKHDKSTGKLVGKLACCALAPV